MRGVHHQPGDSHDDRQRLLDQRVDAGLQASQGLGVVDADLGRNVDGVDRPGIEHRLDVGENRRLDVVLKVGDGDRLRFNRIAVPPGGGRFSCVAVGVDDEPGTGRIALADGGDAEVVHADRAQGSVVVQAGRHDPAGSDQPDPQRRHRLSQPCRRSC